MEMSHYDDARIVAGCARQDLEVWEAFTKKYSGLMRIAVERRLKRCGFGLLSHDAEDIVQDALSSIWQERKMASIKDISSLPYWLAIVAENAALSHLRKIKREGLPADAPRPEDEDGADPIASFPSDGPSALDELARTELSIKIDRSIENLPPGEKLVIKLHLLHGKRYHEIAAMLGMPKGTVSSYVKRGKTRLRARLEHFFNFFATISPFLASYIVGGHR